MAHQLQMPENYLLPELDSETIAPDQASPLAKEPSLLAQEPSPVDKEPCPGDQEPSQLVKEPSLPTQVPSPLSEKPSLLALAESSLLAKVLSCPDQESPPPSPNSWTISSPVNIPKPKPHACAMGRLEAEFTEDPFLYGDRRKALASELGILETDIYSWFRSKRGNLKRQYQLPPKPETLYPVNLYRQLSGGDEGGASPDSALSPGVQTSPDSDLTPSPAKRLRGWLVTMASGPRRASPLSPPDWSTPIRRLQTAASTPLSPPDQSSPVRRLQTTASEEDSSYCQQVLSPEMVFPLFKGEVSPLANPMQLKNLDSPCKIQGGRLAYEETLRSLGLHTGDYGGNCTPRARLTGASDVVESDQTSVGPSTPVDIPGTPTKWYPASPGYHYSHLRHSLDLLGDQLVPGDQTVLGADPLTPGSLSSSPWFSPPLTPLSSTLVWSDTTSQGVFLFPDLDHYSPPALSY